MKKYQILIIVLLLTLVVSCLVLPGQTSQAENHPDLNIDNSLGYDIDQNGIVTKQEALNAVVDFFSGQITMQKVLQVIVLFFNSSPNEFSLAVGQEAVVEDGLTIAFVAVNRDSRCPIDATCIWQGEVSVDIEIQDGQTAHSMTLTYPGLTDEYSIERYDTYEIAYKVIPQPEADTPITLDEYRLIVSVT